MSQPGQEDFFDRMHEWSERKLQLLIKYVEPAVKILGSINQIYYVDGFAGRGTYLDGAKGSPIIIAELAQQYEREGKSYSFRCINVEENAEYFANLQEETAKFGRTVQNLHGRFADHLDHILRIIGNVPNVMLCNDVEREGSKPSPELVFGLFCYVSLYNIRVGICLKVVPSIGQRFR